MTAVDATTRTVEALPGKVIRRRLWSLRVPVRSIVVCGALAAGTVVLSAVALSFGDFPLSVSEVWTALTGTAGEQAEFVVMSLRLPRVLTAILTGASFAMAGAIFQSLARNPLGSPDILGFDSGAALGAVIVILLMQGSSAQTAVGAVAGGLITALLVFVLAWRRGVRTYRLVLVGLGIGFVAAAAVDYLLINAELFDVHRAAVWLTGSLNGSGWDSVAMAAMSLVILGPVVLGLSRRLALLELGDDTAAALGVKVGQSKLALSVVGVCLAALAVAIVGPVAFVAFVCAPVARRLVHSPHAAVVPAAFVGAFLMVAADLVARTIAAPNELPVGIATAVVGAPYLIWLLSRQLRTGAL